MTPNVAEGHLMWWRATRCGKIIKQYSGAQKYIAYFAGRTTDSPVLYEGIVEYSGTWQIVWYMMFIETKIVLTVHRVQ